MGEREEPVKEMSSEERIEHFKRQCAIRGLRDAGFTPEEALEITGLAQSGAGEKGGKEAVKTLRV